MNNEVTLESLLGQYPVRKALFRALGNAGVFLLRYVFRGIKRPKIQPVVAFMSESNLKVIDWALKQHVAAGKPPADHPSYSDNTDAIMNGCIAVAKMGRFDVVRSLMVGKPTTISVNIALVAAQNRHFKIIKWMHKTGNIVPVMPLSAKNAVADILKKQFGECNDDTHKRCKCTKFGSLLVADVASTGDLEMVRWLYGKGYRDLRNAEYAAAKFGHVHILEWMRTQVGLSNGAQYFAEQVHVFEYLHELGRVNSVVAYDAAGRGLTKVLEWALNNGFSADTNDLEVAAFEGHGEAVKLLMDHGVAWSVHAVVGAARLHGLDMIKRVMDYGAPWNPQACIEASKQGHYDVVDYALEHGLPFNYDKCLRIRAERMTRETKLN
jgi:hypothetical protein